MGLEGRIADGSAVLGVVGLGYVGLPLAAEMATAGFRVLGFDVVGEKIDALNAGMSYIADVPSGRIAPLVESGLLTATDDFARVAECDAIQICVPTPLDDHRAPDTSYMEAAARAIAPHLKAGALVTLESTTYPGTTEEVIQPILEAGGLRVGEDLFLAFSPERVDPGNPTHDTKNTPKVVGGVTPECTRRAVALYERFIDTVVPVSSTRAAEMTKLLENIFRSVNIALVNELLRLSERMDINLWEVIDAAKTKPFGFMPFYPGPGLGGHCIPIDPFYLAWKAREYDFHTEFIELSGKINEDMPYYVVRRLMDALNGQRRALADSRILVLGVAYKRNIDDVRESPAIKVTELLRREGAEVVYHDPFVEGFAVNGVPVPAVELTAGEISSADAILLITDHGGVDYAAVAAEARLVLDTRNVMQPHDGERIVRL
ncbi:MAG: nucleotide sugar dehydrogenase [Coriobacteriia bacterium]|nr:nucleotide sugar dehydrogenase [Coriobacteriia bacterium]